MMSLWHYDYQNIYCYNVLVSNQFLVAIIPVPYIIICSVESVNISNNSLFFKF